jgi:hypothetical protein
MPAEIQNLYYYPLSTRRLGRIVLLFLYFIAGLAIIGFGFYYKNGNLSVLAKFFYFFWGFFLSFFSILMFFPFFYKKIHISVTEKGIFIKKKIFSKEKIFLWNEMENIVFKENDVKIIDQNGKIHAIEFHFVPFIIKNEIFKTIKYFATNG